MKRNYEMADVLETSTDELIRRKIRRQRQVKSNKKFLCLLFMVVVPVVGISLSRNVAKFSDEMGVPINTLAAPIAATNGKKEVISIPTGMTKAHPFLPYRDLGGTAISDVPNFDLIEPPEILNESTDAAKIMNTVVSGILYDKYSPSAILNIEGNDYLVKKGDVVNNYKILSIVQDGVTVKLGNNTYKAGIGEILTEGTLNHNNVSNLDKKFGGDK